MFAPRKPASLRASRVYAAALALLGLALIAAVPMAALLREWEVLEQRILAALAARPLLQPVLMGAWFLGAAVLFGGLFWLFGRLRLALPVAAALIALVTLATMASGRRLPASAQPLRPDMTMTLPVPAAMIADLRLRLHAYALREQVDFIDRSDAIARQAGRPHALWVELRRGGRTVAVASDLMKPGTTVIELYDPPGQPRINTWKERLSMDLSRTWPELKVDATP